MVFEYYYHLRHILRDNPRLRKCLVRCRHCRIFFLTHPRNAGRDDLRCPFGCRQAHRRESSIRRSVEYYQSRVGKVKKRALNARRKKVAEDYRQCEHVEYCRDIIKYIQVLATLIERRFISLEEILAMVRNVMRQHSIDRRGRFEYAFNGFGKSPP